MFSFAPIRKLINAKTLCLLLILLSVPVIFFLYKSQEKEPEPLPQVTDWLYELDTPPDYWLDTLNAGAKDIRQAAEKAGMNRSAFLFYTDTHWNNSERVSPMLLMHLYRSTPLNKVIFGGDIVQTEPVPDAVAETDPMAYLWQWRSAIRGLKHYSVVGNHDDGEHTNNIFSYEYVYNFLFAPEESSEIVRGGLTYYYFDDPSEKTRYLCLDTAYEGQYKLSAQQHSFLINSLISTPDDWHIIVVSHIWYLPEYETYNPEEAIEIQGLSVPASAVCEILDQYNARTGPFQECSATVEFCIGGHVHRDYVGNTPGGIPIVICETDSRNVRSGLEHTRGTDTEAAVSGIVADYENGILSVIRIGRGTSFEVPLSLKKPASDMPVDIRVNALADAGVTPGYRISITTGDVTVNANTDLTGFIPVQKGDIVRLRNIVMPDTVDNYYAIAGFYREDQSFLTSDFIHSDLWECEPVYDKNGNLVQFTIIHDAAFIRICAKEIPGNATISVERSTASE